MTAATDRLAQAFALLQRQGQQPYGRETVSHTAHALQTAALAESARAAPALIVAALFHDIGDLLDDQELAALRRGEDRRHQITGADYLAPAFDEPVLAPIRLHVTAKRYLCAVDPEYLAGLSPTSRRTLALQGGVLDAAEARAFVAMPFCHDAIALRRWDDQAQDPAAQTPPLEHFRPYAEAALRRG